MQTGCTVSFNPYEEGVYKDGNRARKGSNIGDYNSGSGPPRELSPTPGQVRALPPPEASRTLRGPRWGPKRGGAGAWVIGTRAPRDGKKKGRPRRDRESLASCAPAAAEVPARVTHAGRGAGASFPRPP